MNSVIAEMMKVAVAGSPAASILMKVTVIGLLALVAMRLACQNRASVRHTLLIAAFALLLVVPIASTFAPSIRVSVPIRARQEIVHSSFRAELPKAVITTVSPAVEDQPPIAYPSHPSFSLMLFAIWISGTIIFLLAIAGGLWQSHSFRRKGIRWYEAEWTAFSFAVEAGIRRRIRVLLHESVSGPMTCGTLNPAILLPIDAPSWSREELSRAIIHELEHVRRNDWMTRCLARAVCAAYWFHPLLWILWRRFILEAERACDDAVLRRAEPAAYAEQLVSLAQRLSAGARQPVLAMANRHDLSKRIHALLDARQRRGRAGIVWVAIASAISAVLMITLSPLYIVARIQTPAASTDGRRFEVASVRPCNDDDFRIGNERRQETTFSPGRITINCIPLARIIYFAYAGIGSMDNPLVNDHPGDPTHVRGGPGWISDETYYIEARAEGTPERTVMMGPMLRALLEERFKLKTHRELEDVPMYTMTVAKGGLKIKPIDEKGCVSFDAARNLSRDEMLALDRSSTPVCGNFTSLGNQYKRTWRLGGITLAKFANQTLSGVLDRHVMDKTDVAGNFNIHLEFGYDDSIKQGVFGGRPAGPIVTPPADVEPAPSIFTALEEQLGLRLEKTRGPREYIVIDSAQRLSQD
jgi:bla regulator protein BlaR1